MLGPSRDVLTVGKSHCSTFKTPTMRQILSEGQFCLKQFYFIILFFYVPLSSLTFHSYEHAKYFPCLPPKKSRENVPSFPLPQLGKKTTTTTTNTHTNKQTITAYTNLQLPQMRLRTGAYC